MQVECMPHRITAQLASVRQVAQTQIVTLRNNLTRSAAVPEHQSRMKSE